MRRITEKVEILYKPKPGFKSFFH